MTNNKILISSSDGELKTMTIDNVEAETITSIPVMTSNTTPSGIASASSIYSSGFDAYYAFNNLTISDGWISKVNTYPQWLAYEFINPIMISKYLIIGRSTTLTASPKDWTFEGSNDGTNWDILDRQVNVTGWVTETPKEFLFNNNKKYKKYRLNISSNNGNSSYVAISEMKMFKGIPISSTVISIPSQSEQNFINYGLDDLLSINPKIPFTKKEYHQLDNMSLGSGRVFEHKIDLNRYIVNKVTVK